ncbi:MAG: hypothetical protein WCF33_16035 [Pseudonocardiaceae bacterium]
MIALDHRTDDDKRCTPLVVNEANDSWSFYGLGTHAGASARSALSVLRSSHCQAR